MSCWATLGRVVSDTLDYLGALRVFEAVARLGSVRRAAVELSVTDGAVPSSCASLRLHWTWNCLFVAIES